MSNYQSLVERVLDPVGVSGDNIIYRCPKCDDRSGHLYVNYNSNKYNCFKCKSVHGSNIANLINLLGIDFNFDYDSIESVTSEELNNVFDLLSPEKPIKYIDYSRDLKAIKTYYEWQTSELSIAGRSYLYSRGVPDNVIDFFHIREGVNRYGNLIDINGKCYHGKDYSGRVFIPSLLGDLVTFYVGRDYTGTRPNKYVNPSQDIAYASEDVWSLSLIQSKTVVICEGVFTALAVDMAVGYPIAVATYGKSISNKSNSHILDYHVTSQGEKLVRSNFDKYIVWYDKDAIDEIYDTSKYLHDRGKDVYFIIIETDKYGSKADAADMSKEEIITCLSNAKPYDEFMQLYL